MRLSKIFNYVGAVAVVGISVMPNAAFAEKTGNASFAVRVSVPEYCEISASNIFTSDGDGMANGTIFESCNTQEGFSVVAQHRWLDAGERVAVNYAGHGSFLQPDGWSLLATRMGAKYGMRNIGVRHTGLNAPLSIGLTITAF